MCVDIEPRIYVACLAAYNSGMLHGAWIDANQSAEEIEAEVQEMLKASPCPMAEDWAIHDYEGFCGIRLSEYESFETVAELAELLAEHGPAFVAFYNDQGDLEYAKEHFEDAYVGQYKNEEDFAYEHIETLGPIPDYLENYIDYKSYAHDLFIGDYWSEECEDGIYVFLRI